MKVLKVPSLHAKQIEPEALKAKRLPHQKPRRPSDPVRRRASADIYGPESATPATQLELEVLVVLLVVCAVVHAFTSAVLPTLCCGAVVVELFVVGCLCLFVCLFGCLFVCLFVCVCVCLFVGWLVGWLVDWLVGWLVGCCCAFVTSAVFPTLCCEVVVVVVVLVVVVVVVL